MKLIYLHGFNSSGEGTTACELKKIYSELESISYDYCNPDKAFKEINMFLENILKTEKEVILIGSSLGGFWANYFAQLFDLKCLLINPSLFPSNNLKKYLGENKNFTTGEIKTLTKENCNSYSKYEIEIKEKTFRNVIISINDEVINLKETIDLLSNSYIVLHPKEKHQFKDYNFLQKEIEKIINTIII